MRAYTATMQSITPVPVGEYPEWALDRGSD